MDALIDHIARILATPHYSRRQTLRLLGGAFASTLAGVFMTQPVSAEQPPVHVGACDGSEGFTCSQGNSGHNVICCPAGTCCATRGAAGSRCCSKGECYCTNGSCAASKGGRCPAGCTICA